MDYDAIVVGLGALGSAAAYHLARRGQRVLGLDAFARGHTRGSSHGESRIIRLAYFEHPDYVALLRRAYTLWERLQDESGVALLRLTGGLYLGPPDGAIVAGSLRSARLHGLAHEVLDAPQVRQRWPVLRPADDAVGLYEPQAGVLFPERCIEAHLDLAAGHGAELRHETPVRRWAATSGGVVVETAAGRHAAPRLVLTAGAWLGKLLSDLHLPLEPERTTVFWLQPRQEPERFDAERFPIYIWDTGAAGIFYGVPHLSWPGVKVGRHHSGRRCDPDTVDRVVTADDERPVREFVARAIPALDGPMLKGLVCLYTNTPDGHFIVDRHPDLQSVVFAGGCSGHAFKFASALGEALAEYAVTGRLPAPVSFLQAARFTSPPASPASAAEAPAAGHD
jgi:sarcosine oxidase